MFAPIVTDLLRYPSLPESEGKDRTMMKNMMGMEIGAMAINGGIGVMEIRQPTVELPSADDVVKMVAQAAADLARDCRKCAHHSSGTEKEGGCGYREEAAVIQAAYGTEPCGGSKEYRERCDADCL